MSDTSVLDKTPEQLRIEEQAAEAKRVSDRAAEDETKAKTDPATTLIGADASPGANLADKPADKPFFSKAPAAPVTAKDKLRAFEDKHLGKDVPRIDGKVERGHGSPFKAMKPEQHVEYAALEKLVDAEQKLADATAALETAKADLEIAKTQAANAAKAAKAAADAAAQPKPTTGL